MYLPIFWNIFQSIPPNKKQTNFIVPCIKNQSDKFSPVSPTYAPLFASGEYL